MSVSQPGAVARPYCSTTGGAYPNLADLTNTRRSDIRAHLVKAENMATEAATALSLDQIPHVGTCIRRAQRELAEAAEKLRPHYTEPVEDLMKLKDDQIAELRRENAVLREHLCPTSDVLDAIRRAPIGVMP